MDESCWTNLATRGTRRRVLAESQRRINALCPLSTDDGLPYRPKNPPKWSELYLASSSARATGSSEHSDILAIFYACELYYPHIEGIKNEVN